MSSPAAAATGLPSSDASVPRQQSSSRAEPGKARVGINQNRRGLERSMQWLYLGPVLGAPITHNLVSFYRKVPKHRRKVYLWAGIFGSFALMVGNRMYLMYHAGYPCDSHEVGGRLQTKQDQ